MAAQRFSIIPRFSVVLSLSLSTILLVACGGDGTRASDATEAIPRDLFVQTYVQLRMESFDNRPTVITDAERDAILAAQGISDEDLREFVRVHGADLEYMRDLWADIEGRILSLLSPNPDSLGELDLSTTFDSDPG